MKAGENAARGIVYRLCRSTRRALPYKTKKKRKKDDEAEEEDDNDGVDDVEKLDSS